MALPDGVVRLTDWGLIRAAGPDARSFLHGQLTQDVQHLPAQQARLAGYCSAKGRLMASFVIWAEGDDQVLLACSADLLPATLKRLSMFVLRSKCKLTDAGAERALWGAAGAAAEALPGMAACAVWGTVQDGVNTLVRLPDAQLDGRSVRRALVATPADSAPSAEPSLDLSLWLALEAASGVPRIVAATSEHFVPQMVNLELVGGVNFQKGCYPGQEVVARSQYRGTLKRRGFAVAAGVAMVPAQEIFHSADPGQPAGEVALAGRLHEGRYLALAELKIDTTHGGSLHLGAADGPQLQLTALPYAVPLETA